MQCYGEAYDAWLGSIKVGDIVALASCGYSSGHSYCLFAVDRLTKSQFICSGSSRNGEVRFSRNRGREVGSSSYASIEPYTDEIKKHIRHNNLVYAVSNITYDMQSPHQCYGLSDEVLEKVLEVLKHARVELNEIKARAEEEARAKVENKAKRGW